MLIESLGEVENRCLFEGGRPSDELRSMVEGDSKVSTCMNDLEPSRDVRRPVDVSADALDPCLSSPVSPFGSEQSDSRGELDEFVLCDDLQDLCQLGCLALDLLGLPGLKLAITSKSLTLSTFGHLWIAAYLLLSTCIARLTQAFSWLASLGRAPFRINAIAVDELLSNSAIVVHKTGTIANNIGFINARFGVTLTASTWLERWT